MPQRSPVATELYNTIHCTLVNEERKKGIRGITNGKKKKKLKMKL